MPEVSRFYGIIIRFYYRDHPPTHFHAIYGEFEAQIEIESGAIHRGRLPKTAYDLVNTWRFDSFAGVARKLESGAAAIARTSDSAPGVKPCPTRSLQPTAGCAFCLHW